MPGILQQVAAFHAAVGGGPSGVTFRSTNHNSFTSAAPTCNAPAGVADGDLLLMCVATTSVHTIANTPTGWTSLGTQDGGTDTSGSLFWRVASSEPGSYTFNDPGNLLSASDTGKIAIIAYSGVDNASPINQSDKIGRTGVSSVFSPTITPSVNDCMIVYIAATDPPGGGQSFTADISPAATERLEEYNGVAAGIYIQEYLQGTAAAVQLDAQASASDDFGVFIVALKPA